MHMSYKPNQSPEVQIKILLNDGSLSKDEVATCTTTAIMFFDCLDIKYTHLPDEEAIIVYTHIPDVFMDFINANTIFGAFQK